MLLFSLVLFLALQSAVAAGAADQDATILQNAGDVAYKGAEYRDAESCYLEANRLFESMDSPKARADISYKLAITYEKLAQNDEAMQWAGRALKLHEALNDIAGIGPDLREIAFLQIVKGNYAEARALAERARGIAFVMESENERIEADYLLALDEYYIGNYDASVTSFGEGLLLAQKTNNPKLTARGLMAIGMVETNMGNLNEARIALEQALLMAEEQDDSEPIAQTKLNLGRVLWRQGDFKGALEQYSESLKMSEASGNKRGININLNNIALVYMDQGSYAEALETHERALKIRKETGDKQGTAGSLENIGLLYLKIGDTSRAIEYLNQALNLFLENGNKNGIGGTLTNIGIAYKSQGDSKKALIEHARAIQMYNETKDKRGLASSEYYTAMNLMILGEAQSALDHQLKALDLAKEMADRKWMAMCLSNLGSIYFKLGDSAKAVENLSEAIRISKEIGHSETLWSSLYTLGVLEKSSGDTEQAIASLKGAIEEIENVRFNLQFEEQKADFLGDKLQIYSELIDALVKEGKTGEAFEYVESSRARAFLDMLAEARIDPTLNLDPDLAKRKAMMESRYAQVQKDLRSYEERPNPQDTVIKRLEKERQNLDEAYSEIQREIRVNNPVYADLAYPHPLKMNEVQALLDPNTSVLEYSLGKDRSYLFLVTAGSVDVFPLAGEGRISQDVQKLRDLILKPEPVWENLEGSHRKLIQLERKLYNTLVQPAESKLRSGQQLLIVPEGALNYLPFEVLLDHPVNEETVDFSSLPYLVKEHEVFYVPSATVFSAIRERAAAQQRKDRKDLIAFADPDYGSKSRAITKGSDVYRMAETLGSLTSLPNTRKEIEGIARLFPKTGVTEFLGRTATEGNVKNSRLEDYRYVHFAAHGFIREDQPQFSSLVLSFNESEAEDGLLMMREVFNLKLNADLVVLSACKTGLGQQVKGEGVRGLSRAFMYAGTPSVLVSMWNVSDKSTADFMSSFYRNMEKKQMSKAEALRQARLEMMRSKDFSHPYYWAPFVLIGKP